MVAQVRPTVSQARQSPTGVAVVVAENLGLVVQVAQVVAALAAHQTIRAPQAQPTLVAVVAGAV